MPAVSLRRVLFDPCVGPSYATSRDVTAGGARVASGLRRHARDGGQRQATDKFLALGHGGRKIRLVAAIRAGMPHSWESLSPDPGRLPHFP